MSALVVRVARGLREHRLVGADDRVAVALSGGPDSVALTLILSDALPLAGATLAGAAHLHHGLRGAEADEDEAFCRAFAASRGLPLVVEHASLASSRSGRSLEAAGHAARYAFYERACEQLGACRIATGHTRNDLAETILLRLFRGTGVRGLGGIRAVNGPVIRPLLDVDRSELVGFLQERHQAYREDRSNEDVRIPRNRVRHEILPRLEQVAGPGVADRLARSARSIADDDAYLEGAATEHAGRVVQEEGEALALDVDRLASLPRAMRRRVVLVAIERLGRAASAATIERVLGMVALSDGAHLDLPRLTARRGASEIVLAPAGRRWARLARAESGRLEPPSAGLTSSGHLVGHLQVPGRLRLPGGGLIEVERRDPSEVLLEAGGGGTAVMDAEAVRLPLTVRFRLPGDRLQPLGMRGVKKLQDLFVDRKVPRAERDEVPLIVDRDGRILWVAGHVIADLAQVSSATSSVLLFQYRR